MRAGGPIAALAALLGRIPFHPVLSGAFPVLLLWGENATEVRVGDALDLLWRVVAGALVVGVALTVVVFRDSRRAALVTSTTALATLTIGHAIDVTGPMSTAVLGGVVVAAAIAAATIAAAKVGERALGEVTLGANVIAILLVAMNIPSVAGALQGSAPVTLGGTAPPTTAEQQGRRDIVWIVPDRYGRADSLREVLGIDNSAFVAWLEATGFQVADRAVANYNKTAHSMASTLNLDYLDGVAARIDADRTSDWEPLYALLREHELGRILTGAGYEYTHLGSWWQPTSSAANADRVLNADARSEFAQVFEDATVWPLVKRALDLGEFGARSRLRGHILYAFDQLERLADEEAGRPRFILAHLTIPHEPYLFEPDGDPVSAELEASRSRADNYERQLLYANRRLRAIIERFLDRPPQDRPVLVLQSDEGPHPVAHIQQGADYHWPSAPDAELREKLRILSATYLPGPDAPALPEDTTPVNTFRVILDWQLGTELGRLPDRAFVFRDGHDLYDFTDVTDRVR